MSIGDHGLELGRDYELTVGSSLQSGRAKEAYHLMRYDFKPASIETSSRPAHFEVGENKGVTLTIPNESGGSATRYKGGRKPCTKDCVLIIDKKTGQITLERFTSTIPLKKCRNDKTGGMVAKAHSEMENMEKMENGNLKKMLKERKEGAQPKPTQDKGVVDRKASSGKQNSKDQPATNSNNNNNNNTTTNSSTINTPTSKSAKQQSSNSNNQNNNNNSNNSQSPTANVGGKSIPGRTRMMSSSDMSVSSASSDSSDSESSADEDATATKKQQTQQQQQQNKPPSNAKQQSSSAPPPQPPPSKVDRSPVKSMQTSSAPLAKESTVKGKEKAFLSTLQSDLQLSDSDGSDSD